MTLKTDNQTNYYYCNTCNEPTYEELIALCKLNIRQLLEIGFADTDERIEKHFNGETGLANVIGCYVHMLDKFYKLRSFENKAGEEV